MTKWSLGCGDVKKWSLGYCGDVKNWSSGCGDVKTGV